MIGLRLRAAALACCVRGLAGGAGERLIGAPRAAVSVMQLFVPTTSAIEPWSCPPRYRSRPYNMDFI